MHARFSDHAGLAKCSRWRSWTYCLPLRRQCRHPGSVLMWFATPSSQWTCTTYSLPVSRRTCVTDADHAMGRRGAKARSQPL